MDLLSKVNIDFMKYRKYFVWISLTLLLVSVIELVRDGLNYGIDFAGGTQMQVRFRESVSEDTVRRLLEDAGLGEAQVQRFGQEGDNEILIKTPVAEGSEEGTGDVLSAALANLNTAGSSKLDLNLRGTDALADILRAADPDGRLVAGDTDAERQAYYRQIAETVTSVRKTEKIITSYDQLRAVGGGSLSQAAFEVLEKQTELGAYSVLSMENVGPQIGGELRKKGLLAVVLSLVGMLLYIWYRFELRFGIGALVAVFHDFLIVLGLYAVAGFEFNLPTIAAFLTLVGYSVNDTVVIFDRVRENMRRFRRQPLVDTINQSINQTLSRTILTSGTTLLVVSSLFVLGGDVVRGFAFVLVNGVVVGTYSSVFVASPFTLLWEEYFSREAREKRAIAGKRGKAKAA